MREDTFTNTVEDAARYEQARGRDAWIDDRPSAADLADEPGLPGPRKIPCPVPRRGTHNPLPGGGRAPMCMHCPTCGGDVVKPVESEEYYTCSVYSCDWTFGVASEPPF